MSLKSYVADSGVKARLRAARPPLSLAVPVPVKVPKRSDRASLVGTAFDYLFRFELRRLAAHAVTYPWVAEGAPDFFHGPHYTRHVGPDQLGPLAGEYAGLDPHDTSMALHARAAKLVAAAREAEVAYNAVRSRAPSREEREDLARHALRLAMLDPLGRATLLSPFYPDSFGEPAEEEVVELLDLLAVVPFERFTTATPLQLNPRFGAAGNAVGGADADVIAGDLLLDLKVTSPAKVDPGHVDQLVGYLLLSRELRRTVPEAPEVRRLGLYYARYGYMWETDAAAWTERPGFAELEAWFFDRVAELWPGAAASTAAAVSDDTEPATPAAGKLKVTVKPKAAAKPKSAGKRGAKKGTGNAAAKPKGAAPPGAREPSGKGTAKTPAPREAEGRGRRRQPPPAKGGRG